MNIAAKKILAHMSISFIVTVISAALIFFVFPIGNWSFLWTETILDLPISIMLFAVSLTVGFISGLISGINETQKMKMIANMVEDFSLENASSKTTEYPSELRTIMKQIWMLKTQYKEQMLITQKLVNERVEDQEKQVQEIISQERNRLARELHDSVSQQLFAASMLMSAINEADELGPQQGKHLKLVEGMIQQSQLEMRALLLHLRPVALNGKTLKEGIYELLAELKQKVPIEIEWKAEDLKLERGIEDHLFRILQESVSNTLRHAKAKKFEVLLIERDQFIIMRITDDGIGFEVEEASKTGSYGLQNMKERAAEIGGSLKIVSLPGKGTRLEVKVPKLTKELEEVQEQNPRKEEDGDE